MTASIPEPPAVDTGQIIGLMSFGYIWGGDMTEDPDGPNANYLDRSSSDRATPAEAVPSWWFKRW